MDRRSATHTNSSVRGISSINFKSDWVAATGERSRRSRLCVEIFELVFQTPPVYGGAYIGGLLGVAIAVLLLQVFYTGASYFFLVRTLIGACGYRYLSGLLRPFGIASVMGLIVWTLPSIIHVNYLAMLFAQVVIGIGLYGLMSWLFYRTQVVEIVDLLRAIR